MNDVLYLESDEEITTAIDKLLKLKGETVSIVVPKRSTLLQSIVNLKLLKRSAEDAGKKLVLVTTDRTATHLAGKVGLAVASTLKSTPTTPEATAPEPDDTSEILESDAEKPPAESAGAAEAAATEGTEAGATEADEPSPAKPGPAKNKPSFAKPMLVRTPIASGPDDAGGKAPHGKNKVPNFNALQRRVLWIGGLVVFVIVIFILNYFLSYAQVTLYAKGSKVNASFDFTADPTAKTSDSAGAVLAAQSVQSSKNLSGTVNATGQKDVGTKATGQITISNCFDENNHTFIAGTRFQSPDGKIFLSDTDVTVPGGHFNFAGCTAAGTAMVGVTASSAGDQYNLGAGTNYTIPALPSDQQQHITGKGSQMSGGTTKTVAVVQQSDIDNEKTALLSTDLAGAQKDLEGKVASGYQPLGVTFAQTAGTVSTDHNVGDQVPQVTVTVAVSYNELAIGKAAYSDMITAQETKQIGSNNQIYDTGQADATITVIPGQHNPGSAQSLHFAGAAYAGAKLNTAAIAKQLKGKRYGDAADAASKLPGVDKAEISLSPAWNSSMPNLASHIKVIIKIEPSG